MEAHGVEFAPSSFEIAFEFTNDLSEDLELAIPINPRICLPHILRYFRQLSVPPNNGRAFLPQTVGNCTDRGVDQLLVIHVGIQIRQNGEYGVEELRGDASEAWDLMLVTARVVTRAPEEERGLFGGPFWRRELQRESLSERRMDFIGRLGQSNCDLIARVVGDTETVPHEYLISSIESLPIPQSMELGTYTLHFPLGSNY